MVNTPYRCKAADCGVLHCTFGIRPTGDGGSSAGTAVKAPNGLIRDRQEGPVHQAAELKAEAVKRLRHLDGGPGRGRMRPAGA